MKDLVYGEKQRELLRLWQQGGLRRLNILQGSVSSGKTWISLVLWAFWVAGQPMDGSFLMVAKTLTSLRRNCLDLLQSLVGEEKFTYSISKKEGRLFGRLVYLEGASDARAENKIRGMTLNGAYCDEITLFPEDFFAMLLSRLRRENAKLIGTTNPDSPRHWLKTNYLDRGAELNLLDIKFMIDDNPFLPAEYKENLKREYTGVFYERFILGNWKAAEGVVYPLFAEDSGKFLTDDPGEIAFAAVGVDFGGSSSAHAFVLSGFSPKFNRLVVLDEFYHKGALTPAELEERFCEFVLRNKVKYKIYDAYCDSAETTLIGGLSCAAARLGLDIDVRPAKKGRITERIRFFNSMISHGRFFVTRHCAHVTEALESAVWDFKSAVDKRLDNGGTNIDSLDALEYSAEAYMSDMMETEGLEA